MTAETESCRSSLLEADTPSGHRQGAHSGDAACACHAIDAEPLGGATNPKAPVSAIGPEAQARVLSTPMLAMHLGRECSLRLVFSQPESKTETQDTVVCINFVKS